MAAAMATGAASSTPAPPPPSTLARTSPPPSISRTSPPPSTSRTSPPPQMRGSGAPQMRGGGSGVPQMRGGGGGDASADGEPEMRADGGGGAPSNPNERSLVPSIMKASQKQKLEKIRRQSPGVRSPKVTSSLGVNFIVMKREAVKRANMGGSPSTQQPPSQNQISSPSLQDLSPDTRATISQASKRKRRKLLSEIWTEAEPIYKEGKLVEGKCIHCHQIFAASRQSGTSYMKRHLKVCEAKTSMSEMVAKMGAPEGADPKWKYNAKLARRKLLKMIVINEMPFSLVEYTPFREFTKALNPWFENISRTTIKNDCLDAFKLNSEWELAEAVMKVLEVFYTATNILSGSKYPTSHLYFYQLWSIKKLLNREESILNRKILKKQATDQDLTIAHMVEQMQSKFNQYWKETYMSACIPVIFDPRYKFDLLEYLLSDFGTEKEAETWMDEVKKNMKELFSEYNKKFSGESHVDTPTQEVQDDDDPLAGWDQFVKAKRQQSSTELDQYLKEQLKPRKEEVDILHWWKRKSEIYPVLSKIACDVLAIPASTVPSESAFSTGGRVVSDYRSSLTPTTVEALICLQDWFKAADDRKNEE